MEGAIARAGSRERTKGRALIQSGRRALGSTRRLETREASPLAEHERRAAAESFHQVDEHARVPFGFYLQPGSFRSSLSSATPNARSR